jgi:hypothetical protein
MEAESSLAKWHLAKESDVCVSAGAGGDELLVAHG